MDKGSDLSKLCRERGQKTYSFEWDGEEWDVHYRSADWQVRCNAVENAWKSVTRMDERGEAIAETQFDTSQYYKTLILHCVLDINGQPLTEPLLCSLDGPIVTQLVSLVPGPNILTDMLVSKKGSRPSTGEGAGG